MYYVSEKNKLKNLKVIIRLIKCNVPGLYVWKVQALGMGSGAKLLAQVEVSRSQELDTLACGSVVGWFLSAAKGWENQRVPRPTPQAQQFPDCGIGTESEKEPACT